MIPEEIMINKFVESKDSCTELNYSNFSAVKTRKALVEQVIKDRHLNITTQIKPPHPKLWLIKNL